MGGLRTFFKRLLALRHADQIHDEIDEEMRFHIDMRVEQNIQRGMEPEKARHEAALRFGPFARTKESGYEVRGGGWLEALSQDLRFGLRMLLKKPGFTFVAILTLGLGIASSTAILGVVNSILLRPLDLPGSDRLVVLFATTAERGIYRDTTSFPDFMDWKTGTGAFTETAAYRPDPFNITGGSGLPERVAGVRGSHELLTVLGMSPAMGRSFNAEEQQQQIPVVLISQGLALRQFGGTGDVLGKSVLLNDVRHSVIGVLSEGFQFPPFTDTDVLVPVPEHPSRSRGYIRGIGRLQPDVPIATAQRELDALATRLEAAYPLSNQGRGVNVVPLHEVAIGNVRTPLLVLLGAAVFVLLIGCANVGCMVLAGGIARRREFAMRSALGAGAGRLVRQLLTEGVSIALLAGLFGTALAVLGSQVLVTSLSQQFTLPDITFEWSILAMGLGTALVAGVFCGLPPALIVWKADLSDSLKRGAASPANSPVQYRLRSILVVSETALTMMLLVGAGLLLKSFVLLQQTDLGFNPQDSLTTNLVLSQRYENPQRRQIFIRQLLDSIGSLPGVAEVAILSDVPFDAGSQETFTLEGLPDPDPTSGHTAGFNVITSGFFRAMDIPVKAGRGFGTQDNSAGIPVAIINETMARRFWPDDNPIGKRIRLYYDENRENWHTVVGVVGDMRDRGRDVEFRPHVFLPYEQVQDEQDAFASVIVRTAVDPSSLIPQVPARIWAVDKDQPVTNVETVEQALSMTITDRRLLLLLIGSFAVIALFMATAGIYGLISYSAASRTHEMGIRIALGATKAQILTLVLRHGLGLVLVGVSLGIAGSLALTKALSGFLFGITPTDLPTFVGMTLVFTIVGLIAMYVPARRAATVDPAVAFRYE